MSDISSTGVLGLRATPGGQDVDCSVLVRMGLMVAGQVNAQVLDHDPAVALGQDRGRLVRHVSADVRDPSVGSGQSCAGLRAILAAFLLPRHLLLKLILTHVVNPSFAFAQDYMQIEADFEEEAAAATMVAASTKHTVKEAAESLSAFVCYIKDEDAVITGHEDVPDEWVQPEYEVYEKEGATCSQIPSRQSAELVARIEQAQIPCDSKDPASSCSMTVEEIWEAFGN